MDDRNTRYRDEEQECIVFEQEGDGDSEESEGLLETSSFGVTTTTNRDPEAYLERCTSRRWLATIGWPILCCMIATVSVVTIASIVANPTQRSANHPHRVSDNFEINKQNQTIDNENRGKNEVNKTESTKNDNQQHGGENSAVEHGQSNTDYDSNGNNQDSKTGTEHKQDYTAALTPTLFPYECPKEYHQEGEDAAMYREEDSAIVNDIDSYLKTFREREFDDWGKTYNALKKKLGPYKARKYASLKNGDSIYESACGLGLNLVLTLEVLHEHHNITDLVVYGNDFVGESTNLANELMDRGILQTSSGHKGHICQSDSRSLSYVPNDSFDLVFTGYLSPLEDPLQTGLLDHRLWAFYDNICAEGHDVLQKASTSLQENWYSAWVAEMIRIAKPGAPIILEQISGPYCEFDNDWGGVSRDFWERMVTNGPGFWQEIDPTSLEMETAAVFSESRYNVYLQKKKK